MVGCAVESRAWTHYMVAILQKAGAEVPKILYDLEIPKVPSISVPSRIHAYTRIVLASLRNKLGLIDKILSRYFAYVIFQ